jgi:hypothetical protein
VGREASAVGHGLQFGPRDTRVNRALRSRKGREPAIATGDHVRTSGVHLPFADCLSELWTILDVVLKDP